MGFAVTAVSVTMVEEISDAQRNEAKKLYRQKLATDLIQRKSTGSHCGRKTTDPNLTFF